MPEGKFNTTLDTQEALNYLRAPNVSQEISTFTLNVLITLRNPRFVVNATSTGANISILHRGEATYRVVYVPAGNRIECDCTYIGTATTVTKVLVQGVD